MPNAPTVTDVFQHVDPDPDAILERYGVESPEELVATAGRHEPSTDPEIDADESDVVTLFGDLEWEFVGEPDTVVVSDDEIDAAASAVTRATRARTTSSSTDSASGGEWRTATLESRDRHVRSPARDRRSPTLEIRAANDLELVGPEPTAQRVADETFGRDGFVFGDVGERA